ncbi:MAG: flagellar biosynthesis anti-sigma factor FlgM [Chloroflexi bacterium]|nr:flagellar biosynthesis anti-sigma factor FlgM [Chloroflexota bacterium]
MKIENNPVNPLSTHKPENTRVVKNYAHSADTLVAGEKDQAVLSERARLLAKARLALDETPRADDQKVEALRQRVQSGEYKISLEELAGRLLSRLGFK